MLGLLSVFVACQDKEPLTCEYGGETYQVGDTFESDDGCNTCSCDEYEGETMVPCTEMACDTGLEPVEDTAEPGVDTGETDSDTYTDTVTSTYTDTNSEDTSSGGEADCATLSADECSTAASCFTITGTPVEYDDRDECYSWTNSVAEVGCMDADMGCGAAFTYATDPANPEQCYGFTNTCIPDGWVSCSGSNSVECN